MPSALGYVPAASSPLGPEVSRSPLRLLWPALLVTVLTSWLAAGVDALARTSWQQIDLHAHLWGAFSLFTAVGVAAGLVLGTACVAAAWLERRSGRWQPYLAFGLWPLGVTCCIGLATQDLALGVVESSGSLGNHLRFGAWLLIVGMSVALLLVIWLARTAARTAARGKPLLPGLAAVLMLASGAALAAVDQTVMVALYERIHTLIEISAAVLITSGLYVLGAAQTRWRAGFERWAPCLSVAGLGWLLLFVCYGRLRAQTADSLQHVWREPTTYGGRMLQRVQLAEDFLRDPAAWRGARQASRSRLLQRYDIATTTLDPLWQLPRPEQADTEVLVRARQGKQHNVVVFFVDTLRYDVATDAAVMPNVAAFARRSVTFSRAYSAASDTVCTLPVLAGGRYFAGNSEHDLVNVARRSGVLSGLVIPLSASRFLAKLVPGFRFEQRLEVPDHDENEKHVWGYGADRSTALALVDQGLGWIDSRGEGPFFLWLFHFDVHNWNDLDQPRLRQTAARLGISEQGSLSWRYRTAAAGVDEAFGRFLQGLAERRLDQDTVVLFISDHGEGLGYRRHWPHAVYLWEHLVHVPLVLRVPGVPPQVIDAPVGHADVAPTLARYLNAEADVTHYHGRDLMAHVLTPAAPPDDRPLLLQSMRKETLLRLGLISRSEPPLKLVLPLETAEPELHDLTDPEPDEDNVAGIRRRRLLPMIGELVRSPVYPRDEAPQTPAPKRPSKSAVALQGPEA